MSRSRVPGWLKALLLPIWNGCHRLAWRFGEIVSAICHRRLGRCSICGRFGPWLYRRRVIPPRLEQLWGLTPRQAEALARKESSDCFWCCAKLRARRLAQVLLDLYPAFNASSIAAWVNSPVVQSLRVAEINVVEGLHSYLVGLPSLSFSDFVPDTRPGAIINGVASENLTCLTYADESFDLIVTSETLEHVPDLNAALSEIHRVLTAGGRHVFTIPLLPNVPKTYARMCLRPDGTLDQLAPEIRHPGGDVGYPVFTEFGADFPKLLEAAGFEVKMAFGPLTDDDISPVYICRKPGTTLAGQANELQN